MKTFREQAEQVRDELVMNFGSESEDPDIREEEGEG